MALWSNDSSVPVHHARVWRAYRWYITTADAEKLLASLKDPHHV
jgi:hypothetical protein